MQSGAVTQRKRTTGGSLADLTETDIVRAGIAQRAYELYETRGREQGHDVEDWLKAEDEIKGNG